MGYPMAGHLVAAGHDVRVWNRTNSKAADWASKYKGQSFSAIEAAVQDADFVMVCVGDDPDVYAVVEPALKVMKSGSIIVDHTHRCTYLGRRSGRYKWAAYDYVRR